MIYLMRVPEKANRKQCFCHPPCTLIALGFRRSICKSSIYLQLATPFFVASACARRLHVNDVPSLVFRGIPTVDVNIATTSPNLIPRERLQWRATRLLGRVAIPQSVHDSKCHRGCGDRRNQRRPLPTHCWIVRGLSFVLGFGSASSGLCGDGLILRRPCGRNCARDTAMARPARAAAGTSDRSKIGFLVEQLP